MQTESVFAQLGGFINVGGHIGLGLAGSGRQSKQEKLIDQSSKQEKISGINTTVLRVSESAIKSKAKNHIIALQKRLDEYGALYKSNQPINLPKNDSDVVAIQDIDEKWPVEYYMGELRAYKRYAMQQKQKALVSPERSAWASSATTAKKDSADSLKKYIITTTPTSLCAGKTMLVFPAFTRNKAVLFLSVLNGFETGLNLILFCSFLHL